MNDVIHEHLNDKGALMPVLQKAQDIYGYLPIEVQKMIAAGLNVPLEEVYGVATFYSQFSLYPKGKYKISVCLGTACYVKGSGDVFEELTKSSILRAANVRRTDAFLSMHAAVSARAVWRRFSL